MIYKIIKDNIGDKTSISEEDLNTLIAQTKYQKNIHNYNIKLPGDALVGISIYTNGNKNKAYRRLYRYMSDHGMNTITIEIAEQIINANEPKHTNLGLWVISEEGIQVPLSSYFHTTSGIDYTSLRDYMRLRAITHINDLFVVKDSHRQSVFGLGLNINQLGPICDYMLKYQTTEIDYYFLKLELSKQKKKIRQLNPQK